MKPITLQSLQAKRPTENNGEPLKLSKAEKLFLYKLIYEECKRTLYGIGICLLIRDIDVAPVGFQFYYSPHVEYLNDNWWKGLCAYLPDFAEYDNPSLLPEEEQPEQRKLILEELIEKYS